LAVNIENVLSRPMSSQMATMVTSAELLEPRSDSDVSVSASPTRTSSFFAWEANSTTVPGSPSLERSPFRSSLPPSR
jgi:hypothetical protein